MVLGLCVRDDCINGSTPNKTSMLSILSVTIFCLLNKINKNMLIWRFPTYYHNSAIMAATVWNSDGEKKKYSTKHIV